MLGRPTCFKRCDGYRFLGHWSVNLMMRDAHRGMGNCGFSVALGTGLAGLDYAFSND